MGEIHWGNVLDDEADALLLCAVVYVCHQSTHTQYMPMHLCVQSGSINNLQCNLTNLP